MRQSHSQYNEEKGILLGSLAKDDDLLLGILKQCEKNNIRAGAFHCIGSLKSVNYCILEKVNGEYTYTTPIKESKTVELLSGNGFIGVKEDGSPDIHLHGIFIDEKGKIAGGHFLEGGNSVAVTVEFSVTASSDAVAIREAIPGTEFRVFNFYKEGEK
ncbi:MULTISPECIES: PPC domain-containing DNA-binding protein [Heyndrickxia]|uniref:DNA-binding protein n=1 Tax=Heyndrickxia sporothermodurans TaxID=46224 RepID=A0AB37HFB7_9BACI|nr:PPC domain-containing DNA-binding protein [Heyndrickxia sporothermodurans]MBL5767022.1 DNA-binding protein [Heyndrickxia sporothermodurans]MBL5770490.1 DNA-binding protein [Heyndrickxia sporothermodurans]MBL5774179.1 DNA-binding protein [Heyndrickxia sporothermodurans]MBL5779088.1 DNA-binding protein [Heyndrickxia sporothermodurans]MBL5780716.1 DNA-binding protein [Heyndrickxia sporothermodurans]